MSDESKAGQTGERLDRPAYLDERQSLAAQESDVSGRFDKAVLTLSGGALCFSMAFMNNAGEHQAYVGLLAGGWIMLALAICTMLVSLLVSQSAFRRQREILDDLYEDGRPLDEKNTPALNTDRLNRGAIGLFLIGILFLSLFILFNMSRSNTKMAHEQDADSSHSSAQPANVDKKGLVPAKPPKPIPSPDGSHDDVFAGAVPAKPPRPPRPPEE